MTSGLGNKEAVKAALVEQTVRDLRAQLLVAASGVADAMTGLVATLQPTDQQPTDQQPTAPQGSPFSRMSTISDLNAFLNGTGVAWYYGGGYAMVRWCRHYGMAEIDTQDLDIFIDTARYLDVYQALFGVPPDQITEQPSLEGLAITLHSANDGVDHYPVADAHLVSPVVLKNTYGAGADDGEQDEEKPKLTGFLAEMKSKVKVTDPDDPDLKAEAAAKAKAARRRKRGALIPQLLEKFEKEFGKKQ